MRYRCQLGDMAAITLVTAHRSTIPVDSPHHALLSEDLSLKKCIRCCGSVLFMGEEE